MLLSSTQVGPAASTQHLGGACPEVAAADPPELAAGPGLA